MPAHTHSLPPQSSSAAKKLKAIKLDVEDEIPEIMFKNVYQEQREIINILVLEKTGALEELQAKENKKKSGACTIL